MPIYSQAIFIFESSPKLDTFHMKDVQKPSLTLEFSDLREKIGLARNLGEKYDSWYYL